MSWALWHYAEKQNFDVLDLYDSLLSYDPHPTAVAHQTRLYLGNVVTQYMRLCRDFIFWTPELFVLWINSLQVRNLLNE